MSHEEPPEYLSDPENEEEGKANGGKAKATGNDKNYSSSLYLASFKDFLLKEELLRAVKEAGFERPSEVQYSCIPHALHGTDILCQAKAGTGKTAVFVLSILNQMSKDSPPLSCLILCHARELAYQIRMEFGRLGKYVQFKTSFYGGGIPIEDNKKDLRTPPHIVVGTPGRILDLCRQKFISFEKLKYFVVDECDKMLESLQMRNDVQEIFTKTPHEKQVMMFSGTMPDDIKKVCRKYMQEQIEVVVEDNSKLVLHGLDQYYVDLMEKKKLETLVNLLHGLPFNQMIIFVNAVDRTKMLSKLLNEKDFSTICIHRDLAQSVRLENYNEFKKNNRRIMVATDLFGRGIDIARVNVVINFDMPKDKETYMHRVGRAGRFETKGFAISFIANNEDKHVLEEIQESFCTQIGELPKEIESTFV